MVSDIFDFEELKELDNFYIKRYNKTNATYKGQINLETKKREGLGVLTYDDGRFYEGAWLKDRRHGQGFEKYRNKSTFRGNFISNRQTGKGVYTWATGETYDGEFVNGIK